MCNFLHKFHSKNHLQRYETSGRSRLKNLCISSHWQPLLRFHLFCSPLEIYVLNAHNYALFNVILESFERNIHNGHRTKSTNVKHFALVIAIHVCNLYACSITTSFVCITIEKLVKLLRIWTNEDEQISQQSTTTVKSKWILCTFFHLNTVWECCFGFIYI